MVIVETTIFTRQVRELMPDDDYRKLQDFLCIYPGLGAVIPGSGGLRKIRWSLEGRGKRGGFRVIYYWAVSKQRILMLFMYPKAEQDDLSSEQLKILRRIVEEEYK